jgi:hypothetical protein
MIPRKHKMRKAATAILILSICAASGIQWTHASPRSLEEYEVKAAFLYNFAKFVEWPADAFSSPGEPLILGIVGTDPFGDALKAIEGGSAAGRKILVNRFQTIEELGRCHILFISSSAKKNLPEILSLAQKWNVLTVGETRGFAEAGGVINFVLINKKIRFEINVDAAQQAGLKVSSQLLKVAKIVRPGK